MQIKDGKDFRHFRQFCDTRKKGYTGLCTFPEHTLVLRNTIVCSTSLDLPVTFNYELNLS